MATQTASPEAPARPRVDYRLGQVADVLFKRVGFEPTGEEQARILRSRKRFIEVAGGGRAGKSLTASKKFLLRWMDDAAKWRGDPLLYWLVAADYDKTRAEFGYIADDLRKLGLPVNDTKRVDPGSIQVKFPDEKKPRLRIETKSGKDPRSLAMFAPHGIIQCEVAQLDLETHLRCIERLAEKRGWLFGSGTLEGSLGWFPGVMAAWAYGGQDESSFSLPTPSNKVLFPMGEQDPELQRLKRNSSDAFYMERIMGIAAPPKGLVFTEFRPDLHIREVSYDPDLPIYIWEDPGYGHAHAIEVAQVHPGGHVHIFDEIYEQGIITESLIEDFCFHRHWWKNPQKKLVVDPNYANQHPAQQSIAELWLAKTGLTAFGTKISINDGTERLKSFLKPEPISGRPRITFDPKCKGVLSEFGAYPNPFDGQTKVYSWDMDREGNVVGDKPRDRYNDGVKAVIYGLCEEYGALQAPGRQTFIMSRHGGQARSGEQDFLIRRGRR